uniref:Short gastrulation n=1 Tax=Pholcus phalangioides TaxID=6932 RepID=Q25C47_PHOPA|nr:Short gastrulation [Pholcus phalangioides]
MRSEALLFVATVLVLGVALKDVYATGSAIEAVNSKRIRPPLIEEDNRRKLQKQTHCQFGNNTYELEERWRPDLGPPFGMLYCIRCECLPVQRKKRIMSRVRCKNIRNDCPKPTCDDPVLLPQRCCKTCVGEDYADLEEDIAARKLESEDDDKMLKEFSVLLTGRILVPPVRTKGAAHGFLSYTKRDLHYSIHYNGISRPFAVRFTNEEGSILEEHEVPKTSSHHHALQSKLCGVWRKVPKIYRRLLQKDRLLVLLATEEYPEGIVAGRIMKNIQINPDVFGALLLSDSKSEESLGSGGMATIFPIADSIHVTLGFNGVFTSKDARDVPLIVGLSLVHQDGFKEVVSESTTTLPKAHPDYNAATVKLDLLPELQEKLSTASFELKISSKDGFRSLSGIITPKITCNVFQAVLTPSDSAELSKDIANGFLLLDIGSDGYINYKLRVHDGNADRMDSIKLSLETDVETVEGGTGVRQLQQVTQSFAPRAWGSGSFPRRSSQEVEMLMSDDLMVTVTTTASSYSSSFESDVGDTTEEKGVVELRGPVRQRLYTEALLNEIPLLLVGDNTTAGGMAWLAVDKDCVLHYQVYVSGLDPKERHLLELLYIKPGKYGIPQQRVLKRFDGEQAEDVVDDLDGRSFAFLHAGFTYLLVTSKLPGRSKSGQLKAKISEISVPSSCLPRHDNSALQRAGNTYQDGANDIYGGMDVDSLHSCFYEGTVFEDGAQWRGEHQDCTMCSCQRGRIVCEKIVCPTAPCENPITVPGECCPACPGSHVNGSIGFPKLQKGCFLDGEKYHVAGSRWYPYIPPFGFSRCAVCTCDPETLTVKCDRITCPPLSCPEKESYREHPRACCKKCPISVKSHVLMPASPGQLGDQGLDRYTPKDILTPGACKFQDQIHRNGDEWHPSVQPFGEMKCVKCHCKDGRAKCKRHKCAKQSCAVKVMGEDDCCPKCLESVESSSSSEVSSRGKRKRKDRERRHRRQKQQQQQHKEKPVQN